tara:strand:- start:2327 stop:3583 length:1257 start_codon:yes stop_codon:yes gene_type:complete
MIFSFLFFSIFFGATNVDGVLAVVEKEVILKSEALQQSYMLASQNKIDPFKNPDKFEVLYEDVVDQMINNLVLYDMALRDTNLVILDEVVEENLNYEIKRRVELAGSVSSLEKMLGESLSLIRSKLRIEIKKSMLIEQYTSSVVQKVSPTFTDVENFYKEYKDSLPMLEKRISFSIFEWPVYVNKQKRDDVVFLLENLKDSISKGEGTFEFFAKKYSDDAGSASSGGLLGFTSRGTLVPEYETVAYGLKVGETSSPFFSPFGCHIVHINDRVGEKINTSHILKKVHFEDNDFALAADSLILFLEKNNVYNNVNKFDSIASHFQNKGKSFQGVFRDVPVSSVPPFLSFLSSSEVGFFDPIVNESSLFCGHVFSVSEATNQTLENSYQNIYNLSRSMLIEEKILDLINKHSEKIYIQKYY